MTAKMKKMILCMLLGVSLIMPYPTFASESSDDSEQAIGSVRLNQTSELIVEEMYLFPTSNGNQLVMNTSVKNSGNSPLNFNYYWLRIKTHEGTNFNVGLKEKEIEVQPFSTRHFTFTSMLDLNTKLEDLVIEVIHWDFSKPDFVSVLGTINVPKGYDPSQPWDLGKNILIGGSNVKLQGSNYYVETVNNSKHISIELEAVNNSNFTIDIPNYTYYIQSKEGALYQANLIANDISIMPFDTSYIQIEGEIPGHVNHEGLKLVIVEQMEQLHLPKMILQLPAESQVVDDGSRTFEYQDVDGIYTIKLSNLQRLPNNASDILSIEVELQNLKNDNIIRIPELSVMVELDNIRVTTEEVTGVKLDDLLNLKPNENVTFVFAAEIPYTYTFDKVQVTLYKKENETSKRITTFSLEGDNILYTPKIRNKRAITNLGQRSQIEVVHAEIYPTNNYNILYTEVSYQNNEKRLVNLEQLVAFYKLEGDLYFQATIPDNTEAIMPGGKMLVPVYALIPQNYSLNNIEVIMGTMLEGQEIYKQGFMFDFNPIEDAVKDDYNEIAISNYLLTLEYTNANTITSALRIDYKLRKKDNYTKELAKHTVKFELISGLNSISEEYVLGEELEATGETISISIPITNPKLLESILNGYGARLNVYDLFEGTEKLKASRIIRY